MKIKQLLKNSPLYPILIIESFLSSRRRRWLINASAAAVGGLLVLATFFHFVRLTEFAPKIWGLVSLSLAFYLTAKMIEWYFNASYYFDNVALNRYHPGDLFTFTVGRVLLATAREDVVQGFLTSDVGARVMARLGLTSSACKDFLRLRPASGAWPKLPIGPEPVLRLRELVKFLYRNDSAWAAWLAEREITEVQLIGAVNWVVREIEYQEYRKRWWSETSLSRWPSLARDWGFGTTAILDQYSWDLLFGLEFSSNLYEFSSRLDEVNQVENILAKEREANVFVIADAAGERLDVIWHLVRRIKDGQVEPALEFKRPVLFNSAVFLAHFKDKSTLELEFLKILKEAAAAGNIILVFDNFITLLQGFEVMRSSLLDLLYPYLSSRSVQIVGLADNDGFHRHLENNSSLMALFDRIFIRPLPRESLVFNLEQTVWTIEKKHHLFFTYPALLAVVDGAGRYFPGSGAGDKAIDLLTEIIPWAKKRRLRIIDVSAVETLISDKAGVPVGRINPAEREKLLNLEQSLATRIVGQREAISQLAGALRRARTGVRNDKRPVGAFLFLGPTGVGKTETAKALAEVMFAGEKNLLRLDLAEYQTADALDRLIGSDLGQPGALARLVREQPYGVLLLDEFEKAAPDVHDLCLTIFDEGYFTDREGRRVDLRNLVIIASSNAGADLIWRRARAGEGKKITVDELTNHLVTQAIFKPELLNRFDAMVVYKPLNAEELKQIARLLLGRLAKRLQDQNFRLVITDYLAAAVAKFGANELFGARPMQRFIQDRIEQVVADGLVAGVLRAGATIAFEPNEQTGEPELSSSEK